jgi:ubiquinone biosynthesis protein
MKYYPFIRKFKRYRQVVNIFIKYGFGVIIEQIHILKFSFKRKKIKGPIPLRIRKLLEELGPTFIKLGQILSTRPDLIPIEYIKEFEKLQDEVEEEDFSIMRDFIEKEIGGKIENVFEEFNTEPIASASLSCVYKAKYKGKEVAVKVQRPGIKDQILTDIQILYDIAVLIEKFIKESEIYQPVKIVKEFEKSIKRELNFLMEARNIELMKEKLKDERVFIPEVFKELTTEKILVSEFIDGIKISKIEEWSKYVEKEKIIKTGIEIILKQVFDIGFFHGDPHPGNIFVLKDGRIGLIDFGQVGYIDDEKRYYLMNLLTGIINGDPNKIVWTLRYMGAIDQKVDVEELKEEIYELVESYKNIPIKNVKIGEILENSFDIMRKNKIKIPVSFTLIGKALITLEGICYFIDPYFKLIEAIEPFYIEFMKKRINFFCFFKNFQNSFERFQYFIKEIPEIFEIFIEFTKNQKNRNKLFEERINILNSNIEKTGIKISLSLIVSSLFISSVILFIFKYFYYGIFVSLITFIFVVFYLIKD